MRRRRRARFMVLAAWILAAWLPAASAQAPAPPAPTSEAALASTYQQLAALRGMAAPGPPPPLVIRTRDETRRFIEQELDRRYSAARIEAERKSMVAWGLIPADYDLRRLFMDLMAEQVSAYYDPRAKTMVLGDTLSAGERQLVLFHELVHALQDRDVSLDAFVAPTPGRGDQVLARQALVEGEAVGVMFDMVLRSMGGDLAALPDVSAIRAQIAQGSIGPVIQGTPTFVRDLLLFPYLEGLAFIHQWRKRAPWSSAGDLFRDPPRSTAQILHPEKLFGKREDPITVTIPDLDPLLPGHRLVTEDELGEFALGAVLGIALGDAPGRAAATGWRGDRFRVWEDAEGRFVIVCVLALESDRAANAVALHLTRVLEARHPTLARQGTPGPGTIVTWREGGRDSVVEKRGAYVLLLEQIPGVGAERIRDALWRAQPGAPTLDRPARPGAPSP